MYKLLLVCILLSVLVVACSNDGYTLKSKWQVGTGEYWFRLCTKQTGCQEHAVTYNAYITSQVGDACVIPAQIQATKDSPLKVNCKPKG